MKRKVKKKEPAKILKCYYSAVGTGKGVKFS